MANDGPENRQSSPSIPDLRGSPQIRRVPLEGSPPDPGVGRKLGGARADFVAGLGRKVSDLHAVLSALEASPRSTGLRNDLRRKLHALGASARLLHFDAMAASVSDAERVLARGSGSGVLGVAELGIVAHVLDDLPALGWGESTTGDGHLEASAASLPTAGLSALVVGGDEVALALTEVGGGGETPFECERTEDAEEALALARELAPDVVLVDTSIKGALELVGSLFEDPLTEPVPIIVLGDFTSPEEAARFVALGVAKTLAKPIASLALRQACRDVADQREGRTMPITLGEPTVEQLGERLADELKRALVESVDRTARSCRVPLGEGAEVVGALWGAIARIREVITLRTNGTVRYTGGGPEGAVAMAPWLHPDVAGSSRHSEPERGRGAASEVSLDRRIVVVADDDPGVTWFISDLLRTTGCIVHEALDGARALKLAYELSPDLVVSDILMPGLDGFALCRALRRDVALRDTPVILLSWKEDLLQRVRELGASAAAYLRKESDARAIVARVREVLRPRARVEARLRGEGEVRGRLDGLTVHSLLRIVASIRPSARLLVRDASFLYEIDLRGGAPRRATRTSIDGSFHHGERVFATLLGVGSGRFVVTSLPADFRYNAEAALEGSLADQLSSPTARARAALVATTGANTMAVRRVVIDDEMVRGYLLATPEPARTLVQRLAGGESPRDILLRGEVSPSILEVVLADLAARGAIVGVRGDAGQDLLHGTSDISEAPRTEEAAEKGGAVASRPAPSPLPASDLVARELPLVWDMASSRVKAASVSRSDPPAASRPVSSATPSSLEDAVIRAMSESPGVEHTPSPEPPPIVEPSELRPRSSNPPAEITERGLPSLPPDAIVPGASSGEIAAAEEVSKTEPMNLGEGESAPAESSIPIHVEPSMPLELALKSAPLETTDGTSPALLETTDGTPPGGVHDRSNGVPGWKLAAILAGSFAVVVVGGMRWFSPAGETNEPTMSTTPSDPDVTYSDIPADVTVPKGQGLLEIGAHAGEPVRIDGSDAAPAPANGTLRRPAAAGTHLVHAGAIGAERSRVIQVRAGRMTHVALDGP
jgi:CheY-like chemotaxis protein